MHVRHEIQRLANRFGYRIERQIPSDIDSATADTIRRVAPHTMSSPQAIAALCAATEYVVKADLPGDFVECGVWQGGSMMAVALTLQRLGAGDRVLWLYDTYAGMAAPTDVDVRILDGATPAPDFASGFRADGTHRWACAALNVVEDNMGSTGYDGRRVRFVPGLVEATLPACAPEQIALLRLDTDFHDSTRHELEHLYPRLTRGGVLVVDDYGSWHGVQKAVDDYFAGQPLHLVRVDPTVRVALKPGGMQYRSVRTSLRQSPGLIAALDDD